MYLWSSFLLVLLHNCIPNEATVNSSNSSCGGYTPTGLVPAILTPFTETGAVNMSAIPLYARYLDTIGVDGVLVTGTTGEGPNECECERKRIIAAWVKEARKYGYKVIAQIGGAAIAEIFNLARFSEEIKADAILVLPTIYFAPKSPENLVELLQAVSKKAPSLPLLYYDFPMMSKVKVDTPKFFKLASEKIPQFKGVKTDLETAAQIKAANDLRSDQTLVIQNGVLLSGAVSLGYDTFTTSLLTICPDLVNDIINYTKAGDTMKARVAQEKLNRLSAALTCDFDQISAYKVAATYVTGIDFGHARPPLDKISEEGKQKIKKVLQKYGIKTAN